MSREAATAMANYAVIEAPSAAGSQRIEDTATETIDLANIRDQGIDAAAHRAFAHLGRSEPRGFWLHLDCDALDDALMPAVDYRQPDGLSWDEFETVIQQAAESSRLVGVDVTIFNPSLDTDGSIARSLVRCLTRALVAA